ncbi:MAG: hypothetical protein AABN34_04745 [Acidobacteriota bacterium]
MFTKELAFFIDNQEKLVEQYKGKILVIKNDEIIGVYGTPLEAYLESQKTHELGTFMIQACEPGPDAYSVTLV